MPLHGSLETFALPDVLMLLASTKKTGELRVVDGRVEGALCLAEGELVDARVGTAVDHVDAMFELLRLGAGTFSFTEGDQAATGVPSAIAPLLEQASERLVVWRDIEAVVPSLRACVELVASLPGDEVVLDAERWQAVVAIAGGRAVGDVAGRLGLGEFDACRLVKELVDDGLVVVTGIAEEEPVSALAAIAEAAAEAEAEGVAEDEELGEIAELAAADPEGALEPALAPEDVVAALTALPTGDEVGELDDEDEVEDEAEDPLSALTEAAARLAAVPPPPPDAVTTLPDGTVLTEEAAVAALARAEAEGDGTDEPINRGLLLKFLSSVRS